MGDPVRAAYAAGLAMLARRELSEVRIRERLRRKAHGADAIDAAVARLREVRAVDDRRVAVSAARTEAHVRSRGRGYVLRKLEALGIAPDTAAEAVDEVFSALDESALLARALSRRLRGPSAVIRDQAHFRRLYQQLVRQGFAPSAVIGALKQRSRPAEVPDDDAP
jgi:SOS response regulatory protein OraA/RecX